VDERRSQEPLVMVGGGLVGGMVSVLAELACERWWEWIRQWNAAYDELLN
jgi:hypothetical protein